MGRSRRPRAPCRGRASPRFLAAHWQNGPRGYGRRFVRPLGRIAAWRRDPPAVRSHATTAVRRASESCGTRGTTRRRDSPAPGSRPVATSAGRAPARRDRLCCRRPTRPGRQYRATGYPAAAPRRRLDIPAPARHARDVSRRRSSDSPRRRDAARCRRDTV